MNMYWLVSANNGLEKNLNFTFQSLHINILDDT